jgi:hypothetical protein
MKTGGLLYGVIADCHLLQDDGGVPTFWDGWYGRKDLALEALTIMRREHPGANVSLVLQLDDKEMA